MPEIRRIREADAHAVAKLWDDACRAVPDGGPLTAPGFRNIERMLEITAWHRDVFALVAVENDRVAGFVTGELSSGTGLLPGLTGEIAELYVTPSVDGRALRRQLAEAAVRHLRNAGAGPIFAFDDADDAEAPELWGALGFEGDMVRFSLYPPD